MKNKEAEKLLFDTAKIIDKKRAEREEVEKRVREDARIETLRVAKENTLALSNYIIDTIINMSLQGYECSLLKEPKEFPQKLTRIYPGLDADSNKYLSKIYKLGFQEIPDANDIPIVIWLNRFSSAEPAKLDIDFFKSHGIFIDYNSGTNVRIVAGKKSFRKFVNDAMNNNLGEKYALSEERQQHFKNKLKELRNDKKIICSFKSESKANAEILYLDIIKELVEKYQKDDLALLDKSIEINIPFVNGIPTDVREETYSTLGHYSYNLVFFRHQKEDGEVYLPLLDTDFLKVRNTIVGLFKADATIETGVLRNNIKITVDTNNFEEALLKMQEIENNKAKTH